MTHETHLSEKLSSSSWSEKLPTLVKLAKLVADDFLEKVDFSISVPSVPSVHVFSSSRGSTSLRYTRAMKGSSAWGAVMEKTLIPPDIWKLDPATFIVWSVILRMKTKDYKVLFVSVLPKSGDSTLEDPHFREWHVKYQHFSSISKGIF